MSQTEAPVQQQTANNATEMTSKSPETKKQTISQGMTLQGKKQLKEQGKQLLLKGCYRMASNKYTRLIDSGIKEFTPRQQAIIYLNCGICFQFMSEDNKDNYIRALESMRNALIADSSYEKTYYRLIQLMRDNGHLESALTLVPSSIKNKEIQDLLKEVRQQYLNQSDFGKIIEKYKTQQLSLEDGKSLCSKVSESIHKIIYKNIDFNSEIKRAVFRNQVEKAGKQIESLYELIGTNDLNDNNSAQTQNTKVRITLMQCFKTTVEPAFVSCIQDKTKITTIDLLMKPMLKLYRGQLCKFLDADLEFSTVDFNLSNDSKFLKTNQFTTLTKRKVFFESQMQMIKYIRLVDVSLQLFGRSYSYLNRKYLQKIENMRHTGQKIKQEIQYEEGSLQKFLISNSLDAIQVISAGLNSTNQSIQYTPVYGGNLVYLYKNIDIVDLNYLKVIFQAEINNVQSIYGTVVLYPGYLQNLKEILFYLDQFASLMLTLLQVYYHRQVKGMNKFVNELKYVSSLSHVVYIYHWELHAFNQRTKVQQTDTVVNPETKPFSYQFSYKYEHLLNYFQKEDQNFIALYLIEKIIQFVQQGSNQLKNNSTSSQEELKISSKQTESFDNHKQRAIQICIKKAKDVESKINTLKNTKNQQPYVYKQMYLILVCMILKLDIKRKIKFDSSIILKEAFKDIVNDMALEVLLLILINSPTELNRYLQNYKDITVLVQNFLSKPLLEQLQPFKILLNLIYMLICDFENDQESFFAKKLGVTPQEVHQVRKLQKQTMNEKDKEQLTKLKKNFKAYIASEWHQILNKLCKLLRVTLKMEPYCTSKLCKVIYTIAETNHSKLYSSQIIEFMLQARNIKDQSNSLQTNTKETACKFFQIICKKCNSQIFEYKHIQSIVDSLLWLISNCEHELVYFQSLLGLVNLSTMSVKIPIQQIEKCLYEENSYIMHAGVCVMNNILIYSEEFQEQSEKNTKIRNRISDLVCKYIEFYRDQIINLQIQLPQSDYSHPKKIYNSLISLATVLKLDKLEELESWTQAIKYIKVLSNNEASELMFKLAIYHSMQKTLPRNWHQNLQQEMENLKRIQPQKYMKLAQLI